MDFVFAKHAFSLILSYLKDKRQYCCWFLYSSQTAESEDGNFCCCGVKSLLCLISFLFSHVTNAVLSDNGS